MIHSNHEKSFIVYKRDCGKYGMWTECHCGKIKPIPVFKINFDEMCSMNKHWETKNQ